jgi:diguanylate cyclase (GGDEF)-like protein
MNRINTFHFISFLSIIIVNLVSYFYIDSILVFKDISIGLILIATIFSMYFGRSKAFVLLLVPLFFSFYMFYPNLIGLDGGNNSFWYLYPITTALSFLFIGILQERGLYCFYGVFKILIILLILGTTYYFLSTFSVEFKNALDTKIISYDIPLKVNDFTFLISILSIIFITVISILFFNNNIEKAPFWALISLLIPALFFQTKNSFIVFSSLSSIIFIAALLKDSYNMSYIDTLTGIPARRALEEAFLKLGSTYSIAMVDIDFFKKFNDNYGHDVGDEVLKLVAEQLADIKGGGKAFRYGGEEFVILFPNKPHNKIFIYLEEARESIAKRAFTIRDKNRPKEKPEKKVKQKNLKKVNLTVSIGVANAPSDGKTPEEIIKKADSFLYKAKDNGRNCIMFS